MGTDVHILVTNDDGVDAPGLLALKGALTELGEVVVFAPDHNWSAAGHTKTMHKPLRVWQTTLLDGSSAYVTNGAPSDCVALAVLGILPRKPDLIISGINRGANLAHDITYSGTVAAAMEGVISGIPSIAVSLDDYHGVDFSYAARFTANLVRAMLTSGLDANMLLNVNVPAVPPDQIEGVEITRLGQRVYKDDLVERQDPWGRNYYWIGGEPPGGFDEEGTDIWAVTHNRISITPLDLDMTDYQSLGKLRGWKLDV